MVPSRKRATLYLDSVWTLLPKEPVVMMTALYSEILQPLSIVKIIVAVLMVLGLSLLAERVSTRFAGLVSGFPMGAAISLFFIGLEIGTDFAARSAVYMVLGLVGTLLFVLGYYGTTRILKSRSGIGPAILSGAGGVLLYFAGAVLLRNIKIGLAGAASITAMASILCAIFLGKLENITITSPLRLSWKVGWWRAAFAASMVVLVTAAAHFVGPAWSGLLSAFPVTLLPFLMIVHTSYRTEHVWTILKNVPRGLGALVAFGITVSLAFPGYGIWWGTLLGYLAAAVYLYAVQSYH